MTKPESAIKIYQALIDPGQSTNPIQQRTAFTSRFSNRNGGNAPFREHSNDPISTPKPRPQFHSHNSTGKKVYETVQNQFYVRIGHRFIYLWFAFFTPNPTGERAALPGSCTNVFAVVTVSIPAGHTIVHSRSGFDRRGFRACSTVGKEQTVWSVPLVGGGFECLQFRQVSQWRTN